MSSLKNRTYFITGSSRGIGRRIALKLARDGANIVIASKTDTAHETLDGTIHSVAAEVEEAGGQALAIKVDVRDESQVEEAVARAAETFGGIDGLVNNASAIFFQPTDMLDHKHYDLMYDVNVRGTFSCVKACLPHLKKSDHAHILTMSPPVNMGSKHIGLSPAYSTSKYGMSVMTMGFAAEFEGLGISANTLWPMTTINTAAIRVHFPDAKKSSRKPEIVADSAYAMMCQMNTAPTGQHFTDEAALKAVGVSNFDEYAVDPNEELIADFYID